MCRFVLRILRKQTCSWRKWSLSQPVKNYNQDHWTCTQTEDIEKHVDFDMYPAHNKSSEISLKTSKICRNLLLSFWINIQSYSFFNKKIEVKQENQFVYPVSDSLKLLCFSSVPLAFPLFPYIFTALCSWVLRCQHYVWIKRGSKAFQIHFKRLSSSSLSLYEVKTSPV